MTTENQDVSGQGTINTEGNGEEGQEAIDQSVIQAPSDLESPPDSSDQGVADEKPQINWEERFTQAEINRKELQRKFTEVTQDRASIRKEFQTLNDAMKSLQGSVSSMTKKPLPTPEEFIRAIQTDGVKAIQPFLEDAINPLKDSHTKALEERDTKIMKLEADHEMFIRKYDEERYPDFAKLEPEIRALAGDPNCPVNFDRSTPEVLDALYNLVRAKHSSDALLAAEASGVKKAEGRLANEANASVASGGKANTVGTPDYNKVKDIGKLREMLIDKFGIADRD